MTLTPEQERERASKLNTTLERLDTPDAVIDWIMFIDQGANKLCTSIAQMGEMMREGIDSLELEPDTREAVNKIVASVFGATLIPVLMRMSLDERDAYNNLRQAADKHEALKN